MRKTILLLFLFVIFICNFQSSKGTNVAFVNIGTFSGSNYKKTFFVPRSFVAVWQDAFTICKSFGYELAAFDTEAEYKNAQLFIGVALFDKLIAITDWAHVGGMGIFNETISQNIWYWVHNNKKISYPIDWAQGFPNVFDFNGNCMAVSKSLLRFRNIGCFQLNNQSAQSFICQKVEKK
ncbi:hypothetical protein PVAND_016279 [Polypedilum vanderplanki]|uniref:C-type lectin domain-containing protein n=1 Tax=Polypedilum vanderplanki TaxID=319348 RepID=A0A9J6BFD4_POLVA|nr:hypothetical protein PVAND_016279 [Polypedilum vanderplanki]